MWGFIKYCFECLGIIISGGFGYNHDGLTWDILLVGIVTFFVLVGLAKAGKFVADVALRPAANQLVKMGTRGNTFNGDKYLYDVITRTVTYSGSNNVLKRDVFGLNLKVDIGKCFSRSTFRALYSYIRRC